jgi:hypothetical protein
VRVLRGDAVRELVEVGFADVDVTRGLEADDGLGASLGHVVGEDDRPVGRGQPGGVEEVLDGERDALRRLVGPGEEDPGRLAQSTAR